MATGVRMNLTRTDSPPQGAGADVDPRDAWAAHRLECDRHEPSDVDFCSEAYRPIWRRLASLPIEERQRENGAWLKTQSPDFAKAFEAAMMDHDPEGPPPPPIEADRNGESGEPWPPLRLNEAPKAAPFPMGVFPPPLARFGLECAESMRAPVDFVGLSMLTVAGTAIGQSINIQPKEDWLEAPLLYSIIVAKPGRAKSPAIRAVEQPLAEIDKRLRMESKEARERREDGAPEPPQHRAIVRDITRESLAIVLSDNPRGVLCSPDEATAWIGSFDQYKGKGTDRQFWLSNYSGASLSVDRKGGRESTYVSHPFCAVIGGIQPDLLDTMRNDRGRDDGFLDRIVFAYPDKFPPTEWTEAEISREAKGDWANAIDRLHSTPMRIVDSHLRPRVAALTPEAKGRFIEWFNEQGRLMDDPESRAGAMSKAHARCARLALILSRLRLACDPTQALYGDEDALPVSLEDVEGAIRLTAYFASHLERVAHRMNGGSGNPAAKAIVEWIRERGLTTFTESDATQARRRIGRERLAGALDHLAEKGAIRALETAPPSAKGGRPRSPSYEVNPALLDTENPRNPINP